jgi:hypothetical protein
MLAVAGIHITPALAYVFMFLTPRVYVDSIYSVRVARGADLNWNPAIIGSAYLIRVKLHENEDRASPAKSQLETPYLITSWEAERSGCLPWRQK